MLAAQVRTDLHEGAVHKSGSNTVTPDISRRLAYPGPIRIGVRAMLVHVGAHEMHEPVGHLALKSRPGYSHLGRTSHDV